MHVTGPYEANLPAAAIGHCQPDGLCRIVMAGEGLPSTTPPRATRKVVDTGLRRYDEVDWF
jgi:hypothetical protein